MADRIYLYKYRADDVYTIKLLCEQRFHFSHPFDFNDPLDCHPPCSDSFSEEMILSYITRKYPLNEDGLSEALDYIMNICNNDDN